MPNHASVRLVAALAALAVLPVGLHAQLATTAAGSLGLMLTAARRPSLVVVPDVRGQTLSGAAARVSVAGLVPRHAASTAGNVDTSPVRRQWPHAGQRVPEGTVVALELATAAAASTPSLQRSAVTPPSRWLAHTAVRAAADAPPAAPRTSLAWAWWMVAGAAVALLAHLASRILVPVRFRAQPAATHDAAADPEPASGPAAGVADASPVAVRVRSGRRPRRLVSTSAVGQTLASDVARA